MRRLDPQALERLAGLAGIAAEYVDIWGNTHRVADATRLALLRSMGVVGDAADVEQALSEREERPWRRGLDPVHVVRQGEAPLVLVYRCPESSADRLHRWTLTLESGETSSGEFRPGELERRGSRQTGGAGHVAVALRWREPLPLGYHRLAILAPGPAVRAERRASPGEPASTMLIVTPERCYLPAALERGGRIWGPTLHLYGVRSRRNWGMGDFTDLASAAEIAVRAGAGIVGLNPLHALFLDDPRHRSPYSASSRLFLNPLYLDVEAVPDLSDCAAARELLQDPHFQARLQSLRESERVDYTGVAEAKRRVLECLHAHFRQRHAARSTPRARAFQRFREFHGESVERFAIHSALREHFQAERPGASSWTSWPAAYRDPGSMEVRRFAESRPDRVGFHAWLQWLAEDQLAACEARLRARGSAVGICLDLAVSVDRGGADAWAWQDLYASEASIGAPPDGFNFRGQDWGLPPPIPERLAETAYAPFVAALRANMRRAAALRMDHVMGLMRLFWIPPGGEPLDGCYVYYPFEDLLGIVALESHRNRCMVVGEDLGTVSDEVRAALGRMGILSYRLLLFERAQDGAFKAPADYPAQAVAAVSTHDLPTLRGFWLGHDLDLRARLGLFPGEQERLRQVANRAEDRARLLRALEREGLLPAGTSADPAYAPEMTPELAAAVHAYLARTPSKVMMVQMEDALGQLEQVNLPGTTDEVPNWQRKLPLDLEEWSADPRFNAVVEVTDRARRNQVRGEG